MGFDLNRYLINVTEVFFPSPDSPVKIPALKNQFDYERAHSYSACYLATNKALLVIAVLLLCCKIGQGRFFFFFAVA